MGDTSTNGDMAGFDMVKCLRIDNPIEVDKEMQEKVQEGLKCQSLEELDVRLVVLSEDTLTVIERGIAVEVWEYGQILYKETSEREEELLANDAYVAHRIADCMAGSSTIYMPLGDSLSLAATMGQLIHGISTYFETNGIDKEKYMKLVYVEVCSRLWTAFRCHNDIPY